jgi:ferritin-like metal-binding protein YciE
MYRCFPSKRRLGAPFGGNVNLRGYDRTPQQPAYRLQRLPGGHPDMQITSLRDLWVDELKDLLNAENQILKALPKMVRAAEDDALRAAFEEHLEQTQGHVERLQAIFSNIDVSAKGKKCKGIEGIIAEGKEMLDLDLPRHVCDAALIAAAQRVEHYEIAAYGTVRTYAEILGESDAVRLLEQTLQEEKDTDERLTSIAEQVNPEAVEEDESEDAERGSAGVSKGGNGRSRRQPAGSRR